MTPYTTEREKARWKTVGRLQGRVQVLYGGHCYISATPIHGTDQSGTMLWSVKWGTTALTAHTSPYRHAWAHYPDPRYPSVPDMLYDLVCALQEKLRAAEVERLKHGYSTLKQMAADEHLLLLKASNPQT